MTDAEKRLEQLKKMNVERVKRYYENHDFKQLKVVLTRERYDQLVKALKDKGITQKQFVEDAIDNLLKS